MHSADRVTCYWTLFAVTVSMEQVYNDCNAVVQAGVWFEPWHSLQGRKALAVGRSCLFWAVKMYLKMISTRNTETAILAHFWHSLKKLLESFWNGPSFQWLLKHWVVIIFSVCVEGVGPNMCLIRGAEVHITTDFRGKELVVFHNLFPSLTGTYSLGTC